MFCCGGPRETASKRGGSKSASNRSGTRTRDGDTALSDSSSSDEGSNPQPRSARPPVAAPTPTSAAARRVDERMLRRTPTLDDLQANYVTNMGKLRVFEQRMQASAVHNGSPVGGLGNQANVLAHELGFGGTALGTGAGRLVQRETGDTDVSHSPEAAPEVRLSGHSLQVSSGPSGSSTRGSSTSERFWSRFTRGGKKRKDKVVKNILAPPSSARAPPNPNTSAPSRSSSSNESGSGSTLDDVVRVRMDGDSTEERRRQTGGHYYDPPVRVGGGGRAPAAADKDAIHEVEIIRLNDEYYSPQELRQWRQVQTNRVVEFRNSYDSRGTTPQAGSQESSEFFQLRNASSKHGGGRYGLTTSVEEVTPGFQSAGASDLYVPSYAGGSGSVAHLDDHQLVNEDEDVLFLVGDVAEDDQGFAAEFDDAESLSRLHVERPAPRRLVRVVNLHPRPKHDLDSGGSTADEDDEDAAMAGMERRMQQNQMEEEDEEGVPQTRPGSQGAASSYMGSYASFRGPGLGEDFEQRRLSQ